MPYCPSCRNEVGEDDKFCYTCGATLGEEKPQPEALVEEAATEEIKPKEIQTEASEEKEN